MLDGSIDNDYFEAGYERVGVVPGPDDDGREGVHAMVDPASYAFSFDQSIFARRGLSDDEFDSAKTAVPYDEIEVKVLPTLPPTGDGAFLGIREGERAATEAAA